MPTDKLEISILTMELIIMAKNLSGTTTCDNIPVRTMITLMRWTTGVRFPARAGIFFRHGVEFGSRARPDSYPIGTGTFFPGGKEAGA
jgi:hypothetical protein